MTGDTDRTDYTHPVFPRTYQHAMTQGFAQGPGGYARDTVLASARWPFDPGTVRVPVDLWYGAQDTSPVHSPDFGASLSDRIPGARRHVIPIAGGALCRERCLRAYSRRCQRTCNGARFHVSSGSSSARRSAARLLAEVRVSGWSAPSARWRRARVSSSSVRAC
jgi:hypothetical protein